MIRVNGLKKNTLHTVEPLKKVYLIGDKLKAAAEKNTAISFSELKNLLASNDRENLYYDITVGQGLNQKKVNQLKKLISENNLSKHIQIKSLVDTYAYCSSMLTHKKHQKNIFILKPEILSKQKYLSYLMIDENW